ncbi:hypothetical protein [Polynucleobacter sp. JS-Fieb-80-E5]|uniref:hypothetical protein n=1 Tax=Polynucleobacter sp. JS-Fieb-80-E5 TaxID=2081050 RepID=UPI001C0B298B|nr:hypothetical protein [Polynucleobacter sp. JS-Fieb-80-E5]MBU3618881.1 hypothetical protein [Polynucleobacter sp. JS-Fieb-80-E5]
MTVREILNKILDLDVTSHLPLFGIIGFFICMFILFGWNLKIMPKVINLVIKDSRFDINQPGSEESTGLLGAFVGIIFVMLATVGEVYFLKFIFSPILPLPNS